MVLIYSAPPIPTPPDTTRAPDVVLVLDAVLVILTLPAESWGNTPLPATFKLPPI